MNSKALFYHFFAYVALDNAKFNKGRVILVESYANISNQYENVVLKLFTNTAGCDQYWSDSNPGLAHKNILSMLFMRAQVYRLKPMLLVCGKEVA